MAKTRVSKPVSYGNTASAGAGRLQGNMWTVVSLVRRSAGHNSIGCSLTAYAAA